MLSLFWLQSGKLKELWLLVGFAVAIVAVITAFIQYGFWGAVAFAEIWAGWLAVMLGIYPKRLVSFTALVSPVASCALLLLMWQ